MKPTFLALFATLIACDAEPAHDEPGAPLSRAAAFEDESIAPREQPAAAPAKAKPDLEAMAARLKRNRELGGTIDAALQERLAVEGLLRIDPALDHAVDQVRFALLPGVLPAIPASFDELRSDPAMHGKKLREVLLGGQDSDRPAIFDDVPFGAYTVCVSAGPPADPAQAELAARAVAIYEAKGGGPLDGKKLQAAADQARAETGIEVKKTDWSEQPLRCRQVEVTAQAASRVVSFAAGD